MRVVFDFSDEDEDVINLASPEVPNKQSSQDSRQNDKKSSEKEPLNFDLPVEIKPLVKEERVEKNVFQPPREDLSVITKCTTTGKSSTEKLQSSAPEICVNKDSVKMVAPDSIKRRKVLKTRIDERGREGTLLVLAYKFTFMYDSLIIC
jgi:DNA polymerase delta subunit 3